MQKTMDKKTIGKIIITVLLAVFVMMTVIHIGPQNKIMGKDYESTMDEIPSYITYNLSAEHEYQQTFVPIYSYLSDVKLLFLQVGDGMTGKLKCNLLDETGTVLVEKAKDIEEITAGDWVGFHMKCQVEQGKKYIISLTTTEDITMEPMLMVSNRAFAIDELQQGTSHYDGTEVAGAALMTLNYKETKSVFFRFIVSLMMITAFAFTTIMLWVKEPFKFMQKAFCINGDLKTGFFVGLMAAIGLLMLYVHWYHIIQVPHGLHIDEVGIGYDAYCIANWGVDRFQKSFPVYFSNMGGGQSALYTYLVAGLFKIFGYSEKLLRVPAVCNAFVGAAFGGAITYRKCHKKYGIVLFALMYSILPIFVMTARFGLDCYLMIGCSAVFMYTLIRAIESDKLIHYIISGMCGGMVLYTYAISYLVLIVFLLLMFLYLCRLSKLSVKRSFAFCLPLWVLAAPLIMVQIINLFHLPEIKFGWITMVNLEGYRGNEIEWNHLIRNFLNVLKVTFKYDNLSYNSSVEYMTMYWMSIPLVIVGMIRAFSDGIKQIRNREWNISVMMLAWMLSMLVVGALIGGDGANCNKMNGIYIAILYFLVIGMFTMWQLVKGQDWRQLLVGCITLCYIVSFLSFSEYYFVQFPKEDNSLMLFTEPYGDALKLLQTQGDTISSRKTYIDEKHIVYFCGSTLISPFDVDYVLDMHTFQNYELLYSTQIEPEANYVLSKNNRSYAIAIEKAGFMVQRVGDWYVCYM